MILKMIAFWDEEPCSLIEVDRGFGGEYCIRHQGDKTYHLLGGSKTTKYLSQGSLHLFGDLNRGFPEWIIKPRHQCCEVKMKNVFLIIIIWL
jgi:hypothetical protein